MRGGIPEADTKYLRLTRRDEIFAAISAIPEGQLFRAEDICGNDEQLLQEFSALKGFDYLEIIDKWYAGVKETKYLRMPPRIEKVLSSYSETFGCRIAEAGEWVSWRIGMRQWEPIEGFRFYTDRSARTLHLRNIKIRLEVAPAWLLDESQAGRTLRALIDTPEKEFNTAVLRYLLQGDGQKDLLDQAVNLARDLTGQLEIDPERSDAHERRLLTLPADYAILMATKAVKA